MMRFKRLAFLYTLCFVCLAGLICKLHDIVVAQSERGTTNNGIPMLTYEVRAGSLGQINSASDAAAIRDVIHNDADIDYFAHRDISADDVGKESWTNKLKSLDRTALVKESHFGESGRKAERNRTAEFIKVGDVYIYGAFLDLRVSGQFTVRLLTLQHRRHQDSLVCRVYDRGEHHILFTQAYKMCENHGKLYGGWIYSCVLPNTIQTLPSHIDVLPLSERLNQNRTFTTLPLRTIPAETKSETTRIGVCVPPLFGDVTLSLIVNFIQMCKILGADAMFLYMGSVSVELRTFLEHHSKHDAAISVTQWRMPENLTESDDKIWYHGQVLAIQHCLYNNMAAFSFLLFMDLDEMLVPRKADTWPQMLEGILASEKLDSVAALSFKSVFFDPTRIPDSSENILYFQHLHRTKAASKVRNKLMVQPLKVFELGIHHMSKALSDEYKSMDVGEDFALLHHYRTCVQIYEPAMKCYPTKTDKTMLRYRERLSHVSHRVITDASKLFA
ncbi:hypothetical protein BaRGS_00019404 [Batillaria attramentaria]|uniref:Glycosyltransferase family 92 protein n=1 Tax=Batillaria attramentaria TaxID=370345 RepID=A0ABD0KPV9_9CAEN